MLLEIDPNIVISRLMSASLAMGLWRCVQDYRTWKELEWLVAVLQREAAYERV